MPTPQAPARLDQAGAVLCGRSGGRWTNSRGHGIVSCTAKRPRRPGRSDLAGAFVFTRAEQRTPGPDTICPGARTRFVLPPRSSAPIHPVTGCRGIEIGTPGHLFGMSFGAALRAGRRRMRSRHLKTWLKPPEGPLQGSFRQAGHTQKPRCRFLYTCKNPSKAARQVDYLPLYPTNPAKPNVQNRKCLTLRRLTLGHRTLPGLSAPPHFCRNCQNQAKTECCVSALFSACFSLFQPIPFLPDLSAKTQIFAL
jgi:hypothetical protein